jgi:ABC-type dipeptide/oligopeptide/nickel transport system permease component
VARRGPLAPGDVVDAMVLDVQQRASSMTGSDSESLKHQYWQDQPLSIRYFVRLNQVAHGNQGNRVQCARQTAQ